MKCVILGIILTTCCVIQTIQAAATYEVIFQSNLNGLMNKTNGTIQELRTYNKTYYRQLEDHFKKLKDSKNREIAKTVAGVERELKETAIFVEEFAPNCRACYEKSMIVLSKFRQEIEDSFCQCVQDNMKIGYETLDSVKELIDHGEELTAKISDIAGSCKNESLLGKKRSFVQRTKVQCYTAELERSKASVKRFKHLADCLMQSEFYDIPEAELNAIPCFSEKTEAGIKTLSSVVTLFSDCTQAEGSGESNVPADEESAESNNPAPEADYPNGEESEQPVAADFVASQPDPLYPSAAKK